MIRIPLAALFLAFAGCASGPPPAPPTLAVVADVQYADKDTAGNRRYREAAGKLRDAVDAWNSLGPDAALQLGDLLDGQANLERTLVDLDVVMGELDRLEVPVIHVVGNHCLSVPRATLLDRLDLGRAYDEHALGAWRVVVLDGMDVNVLEPGPAPAERRRVQEFLDEHPRARGRLGAVYNGGVGKEQVAWLEDVLARADAAGERVVVCCHLPTLAAAADAGLLLWNHAQIAAICDAHPSVAAFFSGHHHAGGYAVSPAGVHHVTFPAMCDAPADSTAWALVTLHPDRIVIDGRGTVPSRTLPVREAR